MRWVFAGLVVLIFCSDNGNADQSIARQWDEQLLSAIRIDTPHPPVHARNLFTMSTAMYDAWVAYDTVAIGYAHHERATAADIPAARREAISYAAYRVMKSRFANSVASATVTANINAKMAALGYDTGITTTVGSTPAALGNRVAADVLAYFLTDGSGEDVAYTDWTYFSSNPPLPVKLNGVPAGTNPNLWQPLALDMIIGQNGVPIPGNVQPYVGVTWLNTRAFALERTSNSQPWINLAVPSLLGTSTDASYKNGALEVVRFSSRLSPDDAVTIDASPGTLGNNPLGTNSGVGHATNPATGLPYAPNPVLRGDFARVMAEFWADGPHSETPPGHWNVLANQVADSGIVKKIGGVGPTLDDLEWDVKVYFAMNAAVHDAACAAWGLKRFYEGVRPITMIRYMCSKGQSSDSQQPSYHVEGIPLEPGVVEVITSASSAPGERHSHLSAHVGKIAVRSWPGEPNDPANQTAGVVWMLGTDWIPYQKKTFVTPAFPGFISGHSTFSRSAAEVLTAITGSPFFPGGLGTFTANANSYLTFERGPSTTITLQWATYYDAADLAGQSRLWGGIHVAEDDFIGRRTGSICGIGAYAKAKKFWDGSILLQTIVPEITSAGDLKLLKWKTTRGMYYKVQQSFDLTTWTDATSASIAGDTLMEWMDTSVQPTDRKKYYRTVRTLTP